MTNRDGSIYIAVVSLLAALGFGIYGMHKDHPKLAIGMALAIGCAILVVLWARRRSKLEKELDSVKKRLDFYKKRLDFKGSIKENYRFANHIYEVTRTLKRGCIRNLYLRTMDMTPPDIDEIDMAYQLKGTWSESDVEFSRVLIVDAQKKIDWGIRLMKVFGGGEIRRFHLECIVGQTTDYQPGLNVLAYKNDDDEIYMGILSIRTEPGESPTAGFVSSDRRIVSGLMELCTQAEGAGTVIHSIEELEALRDRIRGRRRARG